MGHLYQYVSKFTLHAANVARKWVTCICYCARCNAQHTCFKPEYFMQEDLQDTDIPWCCMKKKIDAATEVALIEGRI